MNVEKPPIFIVGVHRSGTTLLRFMLSSHSDIYIPTESDFIPYFYRKIRNRDFNRVLVQYLLDITFDKYRFVNDWQGDKPATNEFYSNMTSKDLAGFLDRLYALYAEQNDATRWGDKTPIYTSYIDTIHRIFPDAQFIHIIRDPYDACISLLEKYQQREFHVDIYFAARNWVRRIQKAQLDGRVLGDKYYLEIRYEDLTQSPEKELRKVCEFLNEDFQPAMLAHSDLANQKISHESYFFGNVIHPVSASSVGRGRRELASRDKQVIGLIAGPLMQSFGYELESVGDIDLSNRMRIGLLAIKYEILQLGRNLMTQLGIMPPI